MIYNTAAIRSLLTRAFSSEELRSFCMDYFPEVFEQFTDTQTKGAQVQLLVEHAATHACFDELLDRVRDANPAQYAAFADQLSPKPTDSTSCANRLILEPLPSRPLLIGRERELALYRQILDQERSVIINGLAGVGKTTLGVFLAQEVAEAADQIFWFTFDGVQKNTAEALFRALAAFLAAHGQTNLEQYLDREINTQKPLDLTAKLNLFLAGLAPGNYVLCFDDFHLVKDVAEITLLFRKIRDRYPGARALLPARFIIMGREMPEAMQYLSSEALGGLNEADTWAFLLAHNMHLSDAQMHGLWQRTTGNPKLLELSITALARLAGDSVAITRFIATMAAQRDLRDFMMHEIYEALSPWERAVAGALSIFASAVPQEALESVVAGQDGASIVDTIDALVGKNLASESDGCVSCHSLVREFSYRLLSRDEAETLHGRAADYYEGKKAYVTAAYHRFEQGAATQAVGLLTQNQQMIINAGQAGAMLEQLARFQYESLSQRERMAICQARGAAHEIRGEYAQALAAYEAGLDDAIDERCRAELLRQIGHVYLVIAQYDEAMAHCQASLAISSALGDQPGIADTHHDLGWACFRSGHLPSAQEHFECSLALARNLGDHLREAKATLGLGALAHTEDRLEAARDYYDASRRGFRRTGDRFREAMSLNNLGLICYELEDHQHELDYYRQALQILQDIGDMDIQRIVLNNMAYTYLRTGDQAAAIEAYERLASLAHNTNHTRMLSTAHSGLADAYLASCDLQNALKFARQAHDEAETSGSHREIGISNRVLGKVWLASGQPAEARACFERSIPFLEEVQEEDDLVEARAGLATALSQLEIGVPAP